MRTEPFIVSIGTDGAKLLSFESDRPVECIDFCLANGIKKLSLGDKYTHWNLDLILPLKDFVEGLIVTCNKVDVSDLCQFTKLTFLGILDNNKNVIKLNCFPALQTLACNLTERIQGLEHCKNLRSLTFSYYNPKSYDLTALPALGSLQSLSIIRTRVATLQGIERLRGLHDLDIYSAPKLEILAPIQALSRGLKCITITNCKRIRDHETLGKLRALKKIQLTDSGEIKTLAFLKSLPVLDFISFVGTNILDGNISHCEGIKYVGFDNKRHYNRRMSDFA